MIEHFKIQMEKNKTLTQDDIEYFIKRQIEKNEGVTEKDIREYYQPKLGLKQLFYMLFDNKLKQISVLSIFEDELDSLKDYRFEVMREQIPKFVKR